MKKVLVIGSGGAGKSTFARRLGTVLDIEVIHLDMLYWRPGWVKMDEPDWLRTVQGLVARDEWIIDGNFGGTREMRFKAADTIIFLDIPRRVCMYRVLKRSVVYKNRTRPDMAEGCFERFDPEFLLWVWRFPKQGRKRLMADLQRLSDKLIIVLSSTREADRFLQSLGRAKS